MLIDNSTLILLAKIGMLDLVIKNIKEKIILTDIVLKEVTIKRTEDALLIEQRIKEGKLIVISKKPRIYFSLLDDFNLGEGEAEALALAIEGKTALITDDKKAINVCKVFNVEFITTLNFIVGFNNKKIIDRETAVAYIEKLSEYGRYNIDLINKAKEDIK